MLNSAWNGTDVAAAAAAGEAQPAGAVAEEAEVSGWPTVVSQEASLEIFDCWQVFCRNIKCNFFSKVRKNKHTFLVKVVRTLHEFGV
jgi:hypothetical protein